MGPGVNAPPWQLKSGNLGAKGAVKHRPRGTPGSAAEGVGETFFRATWEERGGVWTWGGGGTSYFTSLYFYPPPPLDSQRLQNPGHGRPVAFSNSATGGNPRDSGRKGHAPPHSALVLGPSRERSTQCIDVATRTHHKRLVWGAYRLQVRGPAAHLLQWAPGQTAPSIRSGAGGGGGDGLESIGTASRPEKNRAAPTSSVRGGGGGDLPVEAAKKCDAKKMRCKKMRCKKMQCKKMRCKRLHCKKKCDAKQCK